MTVTDERLDDMRRRDREAGALWFTGPESFTALAARDRRELLTMLAEAQIAVTWNANMLADAQAQLAALQRDHAAVVAQRPYRVYALCDRHMPIGHFPSQVPELANPPIETVCPWCQKSAHAQPDAARAEGGRES